MPSNYLQGNTATPLPNHPPTILGLQVAYLNLDGYKPIVAIQVKDKILTEHAIAEKRWKNLSKLFPDAEVILWGVPGKVPISLFASGEILEMIPFLLQSEMIWQKV